MRSEPLVKLGILVSILSVLLSATPLGAQSGVTAETAEISAFTCSRNGTLVELSWSTECPTQGDVYIRWLTPGQGWSEADLLTDGAFAPNHRLQITAPTAEAIGMGSIIASEAEVMFDPLPFTIAADASAESRTPVAPIDEVGAAAQFSLALVSGAEQEPNNTPEEATIAGPGTWAGYHSGPDDKDWFRFDVPAGTVVGVELSQDSPSLTIPVNFNLYDANLSPIISCRVCGGGSNYSYCVYEATTLYEEVWDEGWVGPYDLTITYAENPDKFEPAPLQWTPRAW